MALSQYRIPEPQQIHQPAARRPGAFPGSTPGTVDPMPVLYPCANVTAAGFLYGQIINANTLLDTAIQAAGGTITGNLAVGATDTARFGVTDGAFHSWMTATVNNKSGSMAWHLDKPKATAAPHCLTWSVGGVPTWDLGQDFDTNNALNGGTGDSDFVLAFDYTAASASGADTLRMSPEGASSVGTGAKANWGFSVGSPRGNTEFLTLRPGSGVGGMRILHNSSSTYNTLVLQQLDPGDKRASLAFADVSGDTWSLIQDIGLTNVRHLTLNDVANAKSRLTILSSAGALASFSFGGGNPQAVVSAVTLAVAGQYNVVQRGFTMGFSDTPSSHTLNIEQILDAGNVRNYVWWKGGLGAGSTQVTPVATSSQQSLGWECQDTLLSLVTAPSGTNQTITRLLQANNTGLGFFGTAPVAKPTVTGSRSANAALASLITQLAALGLITDSSS